MVHLSILCNYSRARPMTMLKHLPRIVTFSISSRVDPLYSSFHMHLSVRSSSGNSQCYRRPLNLNMSFYITIVCSSTHRRWGRQNNGEDSETLCNFFVISDSFLFHRLFPRADFLLQWYVSISGLSIFSSNESADEDRSLNTMLYVARFSSVYSPKSSGFNGNAQEVTWDTTSPCINRLQNSL